jgi:N,N'-diacetyllegionaminate synthase
VVNNFLIIGAGISGLTLALELLKGGCSVRILEASDAVGGLAKSVCINGNMIDFGPHLFHSAHPEIIKYWRSLVGNALQERDFYSGNFKNGNIYDYPINRETGPRQYGEDIWKKIADELSHTDFKRIQASENYYEYVRALAGDTLAEMFFTKYPQKLWGICTEKLSARFAPKRIEIRDERRPFHSGPGRFAGVIEGGCGVLAKALEREIIALGGEIICNSPVTSVMFNDDQTKLEAVITKGRMLVDVSDSCVISTIPVDKLAALYGETTSLYFRNIILVNLVCAGVDPFPKDYDWLYFDSDDIPFHRVGVQTRFSRKNVRDGNHILCCEVAYDPKEEVDLGSLESECISNLVNLGFINSESVVDAYTVDIGPVYPGYFIGHEHELARINSIFGKTNNLYQTGSLSDYAYSDLQVLTAKSIDLARELVTLNTASKSELLKNTLLKKAKKEFRFGRTLISADNGVDPFLIAEIGLCHNGSVEMAKQLIQKSKSSGFSAAKIQSYQQGRISKKSRTSRYFEETLDQEESISDQIDKLIFSYSELEDIFSFAKSIDYDLFSTPFDKYSADILESLNVAGYKISSMDLVNIPLIDYVARKGKPVILSTGMATIGEIDDAIQCVLRAGNDQICVLHCVSSYPCPINQSNLSRITRIRDTFGVVSGYSDHTVEIYTPAFAVLQGARVIEKHVTLNKGLDGPDHNFSLNPIEMSEMVDLVKKAHEALNGMGLRGSEAELTAKANLRRSLYAACNMGPGDIFTESALAIKSPGDGIPVRYRDIILGKRLLKGISEDTPLTWGHFLNE